MGGANEFILLLWSFFIIIFNFFFRLTEETQSFTQRKVKMQKKLEKYSKFQKYLDKVLEVAEEVCGEV